MAANASRTVAAHGGKSPFFGTNPIAFAAPRKDHAPLVVDQSSSAVAFVAVVDAMKRGMPIPDGWAIDRQGKPTNDPAAALEGALLPVGGHKGFGLGLMVDILAAGLTGSHWSFEASSFGDCEGGPPRSRRAVPKRSSRRAVPAATSRRSSERRRGRRSASDRRPSS